MSKIRMNRWVCMLGVAWAALTVGARAEDVAWARYEDPASGIAFDRPSDWSVETVCVNGEETPDYVVKKAYLIEKFGAATFLIDCWSNKEGHDLPTWFRRNYRPLVSFPSDAPESVNATFNGQPAIRFVNRQQTTCDIDTLVFARGNRVYVLAYRRCDDGLHDEVFSRFAQSFEAGETP